MRSRLVVDTMTIPVPQTDVLRRMFHVLYSDPCAACISCVLADEIQPCSYAFFCICVD